MAQPQLHAFFRYLITKMFLKTIKCSEIYGGFQRQNTKTRDQKKRSFLGLKYSAITLFPSPSIEAEHLSIQFAPLIGIVVDIFNNINLA